MFSGKLIGQTKHEIKPLSLMLQGNNFAFFMGYEFFPKDKIGVELGLQFYGWDYEYPETATSNTYLGPSIAVRWYPLAKHPGGGLFLGANSFLGLVPGYAQNFPQSSLVDYYKFPVDYLEMELRQKIILGIGAGYKLLIWRFSVEASVQQGIDINAKYIDGASWSKGPGRTLKIGYRF